MWTIIIAVAVTGGVVSLVFYSLIKKDQKKLETAVTPTLSDQGKSNVSGSSNNEILDAKSRAKEIILTAQEQALEVKKKAEDESAKTRREAFELEKSITRREEQLEARLEQVRKREDHVQSQQRGISKKIQDLDKSRRDLERKIEQVAQMTREEAREKILKDTEARLEQEISRRIRESEEALKRRADDRAREILIDAMHKGFHDYISETTTSVVPLPDESMKGRIIGKEGRNIKAFEKAAGVDVLLDDTPDAIKISSFDSIRREIASQAMARLVADGRIQPARIEEFVERAKADVEKSILKAGEELCHRVKIFNLPNKLISLLGRFKFRTSYGQNLIDHTLEVAKIGVALAQEVGADVKVVRLACLFHDIGKVMTDGEGTHVQLGVELLKKHKFPPPVIAAVAEHHEDQPFSSLESVIVYIADAVSSARPGARFEDYESYIERISALEEAAKSFPEVAESYAISAGREVRVIVKPESIRDSKVPILARAIADKIEKEQTYPGQVKVTVIRENRSVEVAR